MSEDDLYQGREQTLVKHFVLRHYLERFARIVGFHWRSITYVDCFAGPWNVRSSNLEDSSFVIAVEQLRQARQTHRERGRELRLRGLFLERDPVAFAHLKEFAESVSDCDLEVLNAGFEASVDTIVSFVRAGGPEDFPFIFIDPTGWTGFSLKTITPLLKLSPGEVLINFMTGHIRRFLREPGSRESYEELFGSRSFWAKLQNLSGLELDDTLTLEYARQVGRAGAFRFTHRAIVLHPEINRTHFHLIYATRNPKGVEVFKGTEKRAMEVMEKKRAEAQQRRREARTGQPNLFPAQESPQSRFYGSLRERYLERSKGQVLALIQANRRVSYEDAWAVALAEPLVWESDLKEWIRDWQRSGALGVEGLAHRERVPKRGKNHFLLWQR